jgi:gas vesicle protein
MSAKNVFIGALIGIGTGAVLGLLFAPEKGSTTRRKLAEQGTRYLDAVKTTASEVVDSVEKELANVKEFALGVTDNVRDALDTLTGHEPRKHTQRT